MVRQEAKRSGAKAILFAAERPSIKESDFATAEYVYMPEVSQKRLEALIETNYAHSKRAFNKLLKQQAHQDK